MCPIQLCLAVAPDLPSPTRAVQGLLLLLNHHHISDLSHNNPLVQIPSSSLCLRCCCHGDPGCGDRVEDDIALGAAKRAPVWTVSWEINNQITDYGILI